MGKTKKSTLSKSNQISINNNLLSKEWGRGEEVIQYGRFFYLPEKRTRVNITSKSEFPKKICFPLFANPFLCCCCWTFYAVFPFCWSITEGWSGEKYCYRNSMWNLLNAKRGTSELPGFKLWGDGEKVSMCSLLLIDLNTWQHSF